MGPTYQYKAKLVRVVDGDTVWLDVDLGFRTTLAVDFRLYGLNAPESVGLTKVAGLAAKEFLHNFLTPTTTKDIIVESFKTEKYGRWLGTLWVHRFGESTWTSANQALIDAGHAVVYMP